MPVPSQPISLLAAGRSLANRLADCLACMAAVY